MRRLLGEPGPRLLLCLPRPPCTQHAAHTGQTSPSQDISASPALPRGPFLRRPAYTPFPSLAAFVFSVTPRNADCRLDGTVGRGPPDLECPSLKCPQSAALGEEPASQFLATGQQRPRLIPGVKYSGLSRFGPFFQPPSSRSGKRPIWEPPPAPATAPPPKLLPSAQHRPACPAPRKRDSGRRIAGCVRGVHC